MPKHEHPMVERYWHSIGGALFFEFPLVERSADSSARWLDALIVPELDEEKWHWSEAKDSYTPADVVQGKHVIAVQAKHKPARLSMPLIGQTLIGVELLKRLQPASVQGIALCHKDDTALRKIFESYPGMSVALD